MRLTLTKLTPKKFVRSRSKRNKSKLRKRKSRKRATRREQRSLKLLNRIKTTRMKLPKPNALRKV